MFVSGLYFGEELSVFHPLVVSGTPMYGSNLFPADPPQLKEIVLQYMQACTQLGHQLMEAISLSLGLEQQFFRKEFMSEPLILFRIFNYPAPPKQYQGW